MQRGGFFFFFFIKSVFGSRTCAFCTNFQSLHMQLAVYTVIINMIIGRNEKQGQILLLAVPPALPWTLPFPLCLPHDG